MTGLAGFAGASAGTESARVCAEWIVIWLIVVEVVVGLLECASILGIVRKQD